MRKRLVLLALSVALLAALPGSAALAASGDRTPIGTRPPALPHQSRAATDAGSATFDFFGSGWGHGIGFSQWGAYGLAQLGWTHQQMLTHYYTGSTVGPAPAGSPTFLRVGLTWDRSALHLKANGGDVILRRGAPTNKDFLTIPNGYQWTIQAVSPGQFKITNAVGTVVATVGGTHWQLDAVFRSPSSRVTIPEAGHAYSRGYIEMNVYRPCSSCNYSIRAVAVVSAQEYLYGLGEVPSTWPKEAMEAQADASRTYAFAVVESDGQHRTSHGDCNCGLYPSSVDQAYDGWDKEVQGPGWPAAVNATDNEVVMYQGKVIDANYYSSSGGFTEDNENVWFDDPIPYLRAVCDPGDYTQANPVRVWHSQQTASQVSSDLARYGYDVGTVTSFWPIQRSISGRIIYIWADGTGGSDGTKVKVPGPVFSSALGLMDDKVFINHDRNVTGAIRTEYDGLGCSPGLATGAQYGLPGGQVQHFENGAIYYSGALGMAFWVGGPIYDAYVVAGGAKGVLGLPKADASTLTLPAGCAQVACSRQGFIGGRIYFKAGIGAFEIHGPVYAFFLSQKGAAGPLGFPTSNVKTLSDGATASRFEHGKVTCPATGPCVQS